jgi:glycosyltransferase involved in cell wall biosynthesis
MSPPHLSLIVPVHQGALFLAASLSEILGTLTAMDGSFEVVVVCDGCTDRSAEVARSMLDRRIRVLEYEGNQGKGNAIRAGAALARGRLVGWLDSDLDIHPDAIVRAVQRFGQAPDVDAVIGSKRHPGSSVHYPRSRRAASWGFQMLVRLLLRINVRDTQVGAKVFRREMLDTVMPLLLVKRYAFDLEVLAVAAQFGFDRIEETSIELDYRFTGTGITSDAVWRMFVDTLAITYRIHFRHWYVRQFASLQRQRFDEQVARAARRTEVLPPADAIAAAQSAEAG